MNKRRNNRPGKVRPSLVSLVKGWWNAEPPWVKGNSKKKPKKGGKDQSLEYVYLLTDATGLYKVGRTNNLQRRVTGRTRSPSLRILGYIHTLDSRKLEREIHLDLDSFRLKGSEWFRMDTKDPDWAYWLEIFEENTDLEILEELNQGAWTGEEKEREG